MLCWVTLSCNVSSIRVVSFSENSFMVESSATRPGLRSAKWKSSLVMKYLRI